MKYLFSKKILIEDFTRFIGSHKGEFVSEQSLEDIVSAAEKEVWRLVDGYGFSPVSSVLSEGITQSLIADIDAIVCYPDDAEEYGKFGKKIIRVKALK
nr:MAG TPA: hypothetical protein [Caudoviricetes sp.]